MAEIADRSEFLPIGANRGELPADTSFTRFDSTGNPREVEGHSQLIRLTARNSPVDFSRGDVIKRHIQFTHLAQVEIGTSDLHLAANRDLLWLWRRIGASMTVGTVVATLA